MDEKLEQILTKHIDEGLPKVLAITAVAAVMAGVTYESIEDLAALLNTNASIQKYTARLLFVMPLDLLVSIGASILGTQFDGRPWPEQGDNMLGVLYKMVSDERVAEDYNAQTVLEKPANGKEYRGRTIPPVKEPPAAPGWAKKDRTVPKTGKLN